MTRPEPDPATPLQMIARLHQLRLAEPFRIAHGQSESRTVLRVEQGESVAEAPFVPYYGDDPAETLALLGTHPEATPARWPRPARLALNLLEHDRAARAASRPLSAWAAERLGDPTDFLPPGCRSLSLPDDLKVYEARVAALAEQFGVLKLKLGSGDLGFDLALVAVARRAARKAELILDVNGGWDPTEAPLMITKLMDYRPALVEQPIHHDHDLRAWEAVREALPEGAPPLYADESVQGPEDVAALAGRVDGVNVKLLKAGSFDRAAATIDEARAHGLGVLLGCMIESSLGTTAAAHLAPWADWIDLDGHFYLAEDDYVGITYREDGSLVLPDGPGIGALPR